MKNCFRAYLRERWFDLHQNTTASYSTIIAKYILPAERVIFATFLVFIFSIFTSSID